MKVVIDTNVVISAALGSNRCGRTIIKALNDEILEPPLIVEELSRFIVKLSNDKKVDGLSIMELARFFEFFLSSVTIVSDFPLLSYSPDIPDNYFISVAASENALLITGDKLCLQTALKNGVKCVTPSGFYSK